MEEDEMESAGEDWEVGAGVPPCRSLTFPRSPAARQRHCYCHC